MAEWIIRAVLAISLTIGSRDVAFAQEEPGGARLAAPTIPPVETATPSKQGGRELVRPPRAPSCSPEAERSYQEGFDALSEDRVEEAERAFSRALAVCPNHPVAAEMRRLARARGARLSSGVPEEDEGEARPTLLAWGELVAFQTLHGVAQGLLLCAAADCQDARALSLAGFAGASVAAGLSVLGFRKVTSGQSLAINSGTGWGAWNAIALSILLDPEDGRTVAGLVSGVTAAGTLGGIAVAVLLDPRNGSVSLANSTGIWLGVMTLFISIAAEANFEDTTIPIELAVTNVALLGGAVASQFTDISRGRVLLIDAGGVVGLLLGLGVAALINSELPPGLLGTLPTIGIAGGLIGTYFLTAPIDAHDEDVADWWVGPSGRGLAVGARF